MFVSKPTLKGKCKILIKSKVLAVFLMIIIANLAECYNRVLGL